MNADRQRLEDYLALIDRDRECRPAEGMLADEILRLRRLLAAQDPDHVHQWHTATIARSVHDQCWCSGCGKQSTLRDEGLL